MARKRLSREDSRERTAQRFLDATARLIVRKGLEGISIEDVAEAAGYSRGAFYSNFATKNELFLELLRRDQDRAKTRFEAALDDSLPLDQLCKRVQEVYGALYLEGAPFLTWTEARILSARDVRFRVKLEQLMSEKRDQAVSFLERFYERTGDHPIGPLGPLAMGFLSLMEGIRLLGASCPSELPAPVAHTILELFSGAVMRHVRETG